MPILRVNQVTCLGPKGAVFKPSAALLLPPKPAIACTS
jgi:hypothetical protein